MQPPLALADDIWPGSLSAQITGANFGLLHLDWRANPPEAFISMTLPNGEEWSADAKTIFDEFNRIAPRRWRRSPSGTSSSHSTA